ncbi:ATP-binding protein [Microbulbifer variabilis]|uniref:ATP-binding protein n=1 Tax=Microbulbifer variabilis TaxID=266805 RepID=UPI000376CF74|nr:ATP-binding protein [Microbulbifer variabilis]
MDDQLTLKFDPNTIEHLGISLYSKLPSVISELVSNSWDADAEEVEIVFEDDGAEKAIYYRDDGHGMSFDDLNEKYLMVGRNRRVSDNAQSTPNGRKVIGKKGLGKLSVFGICNEVEVRTVKDGVENRFSMNINDIKASQKDSYNPNIIHQNESTSEQDGTEIWLREVKRKSPFKIDDLAIGLSKKFLIFDQMQVTVSHNGGAPLKITNELKFQDFKEEFRWEFPNEKLGGTEFEYLHQVQGSVITLETPIRDTEMKGIYLTSRGKIVNNAGFYGLRDTDQFHSYVTGYLEVDFIDDVEDDLISTDRHSLNWEHDITRDLQSYLQQVIKKIGAQWRARRAAKKKKSITAETGLNIEDWEAELTSIDKTLAKKIISPILENSNLDVDESSKIIGSVIGKFENATYKEYAHQIADTIHPDELPKFLKLIDEWKATEAAQISSLALARVQVIKRFEQFLETDTKEVPTLHNFLKRFSWLLDPRIIEFKDEVTFSKLLQETYPEVDLDETDRRIDFLCSNALGGILYVIEIKRSNYKVDLKAIDQAFDYKSFLEEKYASQSGFSSVVCYVIGGEKSSERVFRHREKSYSDSGAVFVKTYRELLEQSKTHHQEFIDACGNLPTE